MVPAIEVTTVCEKVWLPLLRLPCFQKLPLLRGPGIVKVEFEAPTSLSLHKVPKPYFKRTHNFILDFMSKTVLSTDLAHSEKTMDKVKN